MEPLGKAAPLASIYATSVSSLRAARERISRRKRSDDASPVHSSPTLETSPTQPLGIPARSPETSPMANESSDQSSVYDSSSSEGTVDDGEEFSDTIAWTGWFRNSGDSTQSFEEVSRHGSLGPERKVGKVGITRMSKRLVRKEAIAQLGYPFEDEGKFIHIRRALKKEQVYELIRISKQYMESLKPPKTTTYLDKALAFMDRRKMLGCIDEDEDEEWTNTQNSESDDDSTYSHPPPGEGSLITDPTTISGAATNIKPVGLTMQSYGLDDHDMDQKDDRYSVRSIEDDINSIAESTTSSEPRALAIRYLAELFLRDNDLRDISSQALANMDEEKYLRNNRRLLKTYFLHAQVQAQSKLQSFALGLLRSRRRRTEISRIMSQTLGGKPSQLQVNLNEDIDNAFLLQKMLFGSEEHSDPNATTEADHDPDCDQDSDCECGVGLEDECIPVLRQLHETAEFFTSGAPFEAYKIDLDRFVRGLPPAAESFLTAIKQRSVDKAQALLEIAGPSIACNEYEWINESFAIGYSAKDVVEALIQENDPWIYFSQPKLESKMVPRHHQQGCIHQFSRPDVARDSALCHAPQQDKDKGQALADSKDIKHMVAMMCGLAGIIPLSETMTDWNGEYRVVEDTYSNMEIGFSPVRSGSTIIWLATIERIHDAFVAFVSLCGWLQEMGLCCNSFTILVSHSDGNIVEAVPVHFSSIRELKDAFDLVPVNGADIESLRNLCMCSTDILNILRPSQILAQELQEPIAYEHLLSEASQSTALAVQVLCLGMLSFSQAHVGTLAPFFLEHELERIGLMGLITNEARILLEMSPHELTCMGEMLGNKVMAFAAPQRRQVPNDLLVRPEDLLDTWGPGTFIADPSDDTTNLVAISVGGGIIQRHNERSDLLHWSLIPSISTPSLTGIQFSGSGPLLIGGRATINVTCPLSRRPLTIPAGIFDHFLGVSKDRWQLCQRQFGGQLGSNYAMMTGNLTWIKTSGTTLKDQIIGNDLDISFIYFLDGPWGLKLSSCTGVAMRVPLREVVADVIDPIMEGIFPPISGWTDLRDNHRTLEHLRSPDFCVWMKTLSNDLQQSLAIAVRHVLHVLAPTGFDEEEQELVVAYALPNSEPRSLRIPCKDHQLWVKILKDSRYCATFACLSTKCFQTRTRKCKGLSHPVSSVLRSPALLATAVIQVKMDRQEFQIIVSELEVGAEYWFGESVPELKAKVVKIDPGSPTAEVCLHIEQCGIPAHLFKRLRVKQSPAIQLMERRNWTIGAAREVLLLDRTK